MKQIQLVVMCLVAMSCQAFGQEPDKSAGRTASTQGLSASSQLYREIAQMDQALFDAFNSRNLDKMRTLFARDLEFYQDNEGLAGYAQTIKDFGEMFKQPDKIRRELIEGSLEVYPIKNYGAIEIGSHRFCHMENGKEECGTFKFVQVWQKRSGEWKLKRVISYNH